MRVIVAYDISDEYRLRKVAKISEDYGTRVQKSIFELNITTNKLQEYIERIRRTIDPAVDGVKFFPLCNGCAHRKVEIIGQGFVVDFDTEFSIL
ncbi:MAG: CRISPR-associated endonuclease Cas2 [Syntrophales bacterium]|nr:CRISPR-associated endonuclease Cas2 [Syntrophales bacterium]